MSNIIPKKIKFLVPIFDKEYYPSALVFPCDSKKWNKSIEEHQRYFIRSNYNTDKFEIIEIENSDISLELLTDRFKYISSGSSYATFIKIKHRDLDRFGFDLTTMTYTTDLLRIIHKSGNVIGNIIQGSFYCIHVPRYSGRVLTTFELEDISDETQLKKKKIGDLISDQKRTSKKQVGHIYYDKDGYSYFYLGTINHFNIKPTYRTYGYSSGLFLFRMPEFGYCIDSSERNSKYHVVIDYFDEKQFLLTGVSSILNTLFLNKCLGSVKIFDESAFKRKLFVDGGELLKIADPNITDDIVNFSNAKMESTPTENLIITAQYEKLSDPAKKVYEDFLDKSLSFHLYRGESREEFIRAALQKRDPNDYRHKYIYNAMNVCKEGFKKMLKDKYGISYSG